MREKLIIESRLGPKTGRTEFRNFVGTVSLGLRRDAYGLQCLKGSAGRWEQIQMVKLDG